MLHSLRLNGFKGFAELSLADLAPVNLVVGSNGAGKSSLLQAIFMLFEEADPDKLLTIAPTETEATDAEQLRRAIQWLFHEPSAGTGSLFETGTESDDEPLFRPTGCTLSGEYTPRGIGSGSPAPSRRKRELQIEHRPSVMRPQHGWPSGGLPNGTELGDRSLDQIRASAESLVHLRLTDDDESAVGTLYLSNTFGAFGEAPRVPAKMPVIIQRPGPALREQLPRAWDQVPGSQRDTVLDLLRAFDQDTVDLRIGVGSGDQPVLRVEHKHLGLVPLGVLGEGFASALRIACALVSKRFRILLLDEFDNPFHVSILPRLASFLSECVARFDIQVFATTHRADTVQAFIEQLAIDSPSSLQFVQLRRSNHTLSASQITGGSAVELQEKLEYDFRWPS